jgi:hypothetical protein
MPLLMFLPRLCHDLARSHYHAMLLKFRFHAMIPATLDSFRFMNQICPWDARIHQKTHSKIRRRGICPKRRYLLHRLE